MQGMQNETKEDSRRRFTMIQYFKNRVEIAKGFMMAKRSWWCCI